VTARIWIGLGAVAASAALAVLIAVPLRGDAPSARQTTVETRLVPRTHVFGDPVTAELEVRLGRGIDARTVRVEPSFRPYVVTKQHRARGRGTLRFTYRLECLASACAPRAPERQVVFNPAAVRVGSHTARVPWPPLTVASRLTADDLTNPRFRTDVRIETTTDGGLDARLIGWPLGALAAGLAMVGLGLVVMRRDPLLRREAAPGVPRLPTPLERAVENVREAMRTSPDELRRALERLARLLDTSGRAELAHDARRLAWAAGTPAGTDIRRVLDAALQPGV
jgi:hypothetical protein